jgi:hypothetical protein
MAIWFDFVGSLIIAALLGLGVVGLNADLATQNYGGALVYAARGNADYLTRILEDDLLKAGYGASGGLLLADSTQVRFVADLDADGVVDTLHYYTGPSIATSQNPHDFVVYRSQSGQSLQSVRAGVTQWSLNYFGVDGAPLTAPVDLDAVRGIAADITVESAAPWDGVYTKAFARVRVMPKNLGL